jgi:hypothetical protein
MHFIHPHEKISTGLALQARYKLSSDATDIKMQEATVVKTQQV